MATLTSPSLAGNSKNGHPPAWLKPNFPGIPERLAGSLCRWVLWKPSLVTNKSGTSYWTKVPVSAKTHFEFKRKEMESLVTLDEAKKVYDYHAKRKGWGGVGVSFHGGEGLVAIDFDDCLEHGDIASEELKNFIFSLGSYTERSPSGSGLRVFADFRSDWLFNLSCQPDSVTKEPKPFATRYGCKGIEAWTYNKYSTVTGAVFAPELSQVRQNSAVLEAFLLELKDSTGEKVKVAGEERQTTPKKDISNLPSLTEEQVREALKTQDPDCRVDEWVTLGFAIHDWNDGETGLRVWDDWSKAGSKYQANYSHGKSETAVRWKNFKKGSTTIATLIERARKAGWKAPLEAEAEEGRKAYEQAKANNSSPETPVELPDKFPASDTGNAERLLQSPEGQRMRYFVDAGYWITFNGKKWVVDTEGLRCQRFALATIRRASSQTSKIKDPKERREAEAFFLRSESAFALKATVQVAKTLAGFQIEDPDRLDSDPALLNTPNGVVNLRECRLEAHRPELMMTKSTKYSVDFESDCPKWKACLREWMCEDDELVEALELITGASVTGFTPELMAIFYGSTANNGKSTYCETIREVLGNEYAGGVGSKLLVSDHRYSGGDTASPSIAGLRGLRLVLPDEWKEDARLDEATLKRICSQDSITARMLHQNPITFRPTHTVILRTNHLPKVSADDAGAWRRIYPFPWNFQVQEDRKDEGLRQRLLKEEGHAILGWLCRCAMKFIKLHEAGKGIPKPSKVSELKDKYRSEADVLAQWAESEAEFGEFPPYFISTKTLRDSLEAFAQERGEKPEAISHRQFADYLIRHGCCPMKKWGERGYKGLRLKPSEGGSEGTESPDGVERGGW